MTHEEISYHTKKTLASALKNSMEQKPLSKITISELCKICGINRKTFYYHFEDVYALLRWMLEDEALNIVSKLDLPKDHEKILYFIIDYVDANKHILNCVYDAIGRDGMKRIFFSDLKQSVNVIIESMERDMNKTLSPHYKQFLCNFYANAFSGLLLDWFIDRSICTREEIISDISFTVRTSLKSIIRHARPSD